jgi:UDP-N-acetylmuramoyl-tripeptide--D-alanyl-D-alanine ligase
MKKIVQLILKILAKIVLNKYKPEVIGVTGSIGKTSAKEAIYTVLKDHFNVRQSPKNYNNELGVPLTILGANSPGRSLIGWLKLFKKFFQLILHEDNNYPPILILEMGVDRIGDMDYLMSIARPNIGVVTMVGNSHLEYFGKIENIKKEKQGLIDNLSKNGLAVLNYDNEWTKMMIKESRSKVMSYGLDDGADLCAQEINFNLIKDKKKIQGISFKISYEGALVPIHLLNAVGYPSIYATLPAIAVGLYYQINLVEIALSLRNFSLPVGRLRLINGINESVIIDDTYNAAGDSVLAALEVIENIELGQGRRIVVLGDMLELGPESEADHIRVGEKVAEIDPDLLVLVGEQARLIGAGAIARDFAKNKIINFSDSLTAKTALAKMIGKGDVILIKGSQGIRLERVVKELMAEPEKAPELLVRQGDNWDA